MPETAPTETTSAPAGPIKTVLVLGAGTAGLMAAAALKRKLPELAITVLQSSDIPIIGVGEGTTVTVTDYLHDFLRVPSAPFFDVARPTWEDGHPLQLGAAESVLLPVRVQRRRLRAAVCRHPIGFYSGDKLDYVDPSGRP